MRRPLALIATIEELTVIATILIHFTYSSSTLVTGPFRRVLGHGLIP